MAYCGPHGIPHSHFLGGPRVWTEADRDKALAWQYLENQTCNGCGTRAEEWDPEQGGHRHAYTFAPGICAGCEAKERTEAHMNSDEWSGQRGKTLTRRRRDPSAKEDVRGRT